MTTDLREIRDQLLPGLIAIERYSYGYSDFRSLGLCGDDTTEIIDLGASPLVIDGEWTRVETPPLLERHDPAA